MPNETTIQDVLGRELTDYELDNFSTLLSIAIERLGQVLCTEITFQESGHEPTERLFDPRFGYRSLIVDPFTTITSVEVDGEEVDTADYVVRHFDRYNGDWYNTVQFTEVMMSDDPIAVTADWGYGETWPGDLTMLLARLFTVVAKEQLAGSGRVVEKEIEGFRVKYDTKATSYEQFLIDNTGTIQRYRQCPYGEVQHGSVRHF